jgi:SanA protein
MKLSEIWRKKRVRMIVVIIAIAMALAVLSVAGINLYVISKARGRIVSANDAPARTVAILLGARVYQSGNMPAMTSDRIITAVDLYKRGLAQKLLISGDHGRERYDEVNAMRLYALKLGVPAEDIFLDHAGFSTYESMYRAREIFGIHQALIVTQQFHLPRAIYIAQELGIDAIGVPADITPYGSHRFYQSFRELFAKCKAVLQVTLHTRPQFLGPQISINGDGRTTWDEKD